MCIEPEDFSTTTIVTQYRVASYTLETTPNFSMHCIFCLTFSRNGSSTFLRVNRQNGLASSIVYSLLNVPSPENSVGYCSGMYTLDNDIYTGCYLKCLDGCQT